MPKKNGLRRTDVRIRMYRVGFGDCFLMSLPVGGSFAHILIDCGVHARGDIGTMDRVIENIAGETNGKLALVIVTHRHRDHISGFASGADVFHTFEIDEVWMPWTEQPDDRDALRLRKKHLALAGALESHFAAAPPSSPAALDAVLNASGNQKALDLLHAGFACRARVRFFQAGDRLDSVCGIQDAAACFLGPPRSAEFLSRMDPPKAEGYLRAVGGRTVEVNKVEPFAPKWVRQPSDPELKNLAFAPKEQQELREELRRSCLEELAFALDDALNNTSLVTLFTFRGLKLLFSGDAQYGNWQAWLDRPDAAELLRQVDFYKVSHHGSHNGTPRRAVEGMPQAHFVAMVPTQDKPFPSIPRRPLMAALEQRTGNRVVRSDIVDVAKAPKGPPAGKLPAHFSKGEFWVDWVSTVGAARPAKPASAAKD